MANRIMLNQTSYHGAGAIGEIVNEGTVWATAAQGFAGPVAVQVTLDGLSLIHI